MSYIEVSYPEDKPAFYQMLQNQLQLYTGDAPCRTAALANAAAVLRLAFPQANWVGFYLVHNGELTLGPFQGKPAVSHIGYGKGVCGTAWQQGKAQVVAEVACFAGHIACDCNTHAEIVIPLFRADGDIWGMLDMDSTLPGCFTDEDRQGLERALRPLARFDG